MASTNDILARIDDVINYNRKIFWIYVFLTAILFLIGAACLICALVQGKYIWSVPPAFTTGFLIWPLNQINQLRRDNVALATVPILITKLPKDKAAKEIQKLIGFLYGDEKDVRKRYNIRWKD